jgi:hypothetical protein
MPPRRLSERDLHTLFTEWRTELDLCDGETEYAQNAIEMAEKMLMMFSLTLVAREVRGDDPEPPANPPETGKNTGS